MQTQSGDEHIRQLAAFIHSNERGLAESGPTRRRIQQRQSSQSLFSWLSSPPPNAPVLFRTDTHHLFYLLIRMEALGLSVGDLDIHVDAPSRPMSFANIYSGQDNVDALSFTSLRSSFSVVSNFSLGGNWWSRYDPPNIDTELRYIFSSFTKLPALAVGPPGHKAIAELMQDPQGQNAVPLDAFKNLQRLECEDIDPRTLLGWDRLAESLRFLKIKNSGLQDISVVFIGAVLDDQARREGSPSRKRHRKIPTMPLSRSIPGTSLDALDEELSELSAEVDTSSPHRLSSLKWAFLKHLYLPDNGLTFFPVETIPYLKSITHLDLSSNLLVSIPPGLAELYHLLSLNVSDNLIDSVLGIYQNLGQILTLNISRNRLESLCGLERLLALERVDIRHNLLEESSEVGRLAVLPNISEIFVQGNPFVDIEDGYRVTCFDFFWKEGKHILLDGTGPSLYERRSLVPQDEPSSTIPPFISSSAPVIAVEHSRHHSTSSPDPHHGGASPSPQPSPYLGPSTAPGISAHRKKKPKRIVDFNEADSNPSSRSHSRKRSMDHHKVEQAAEGTSKAGGTLVSTADGNVVGADIPTVEEVKKPILSRHRSTASDSEPIDDLPPRRPRHSRYQTEYNPSSMSPSAAANGPISQWNSTPFTRPNRTSTMSRAEIRRGRVSASVFEATGSNAWPQPDGAVDDPETYRKKIELLKRDMGDSWLKVYNQSQPSPPPP